MVGGDRTHDNSLHRRALYQLSYYHHFAVFLRVNTQQAKNFSAHCSFQKFPSFPQGIVRHLYGVYKIQELAYKIGKV